MGAFIKYTDRGLDSTLNHIYNSSALVGPKNRSTLKDEKQQNIVSALTMKMGP
jgi:hypothetical protein